VARDASSSRVVMLDRIPQSDPPLLDQIFKFDPDHPLLPDHTVDQPFVFSQQGFQAV